MPDDLNKKEMYWVLKEEALCITAWTLCFGSAMYHCVDTVLWKGLFVFD